MNNLTIKDLKSLRKSEFPNGESTSEQAEKNRKTGRQQYLRASARPVGGRTRGSLSPAAFAHAFISSSPFSYPLLPPKAAATASEENEQQRSWRS